MCCGTGDTGEWPVVFGSCCPGDGEKRSYLKAERNIHLDFFGGRVFPFSSVLVLILNELTMYPKLVGLELVTA